MNTTGQARGVFPLNSIIRTAVVFLTAIGLALTVQTGASAAGARDAALPDAIVNGDFEYLGESLLAEADDTRNFANVDYEHAQASTFSSMGGAWFDVRGFDAAAFGWRSNQTDTSVDGRAPIVEIQRSRDRSNIYGEITASQAGTYIYQDIDTRHETDTVYTVSLRHANRGRPSDNNGHMDALRVLIGPPGRERAVELTRTGSDVGDAIGETSEIVRSGAWGWIGEWDTYEGTVVIPAGQPVTRFTFQSVDSLTDVEGNLVDDITFAVGYPLTYDLNGGTGPAPNRA